MSPRGRLIVTPGGPWRLYQHIDLPGWQMLGTVQRGSDVGALARNTQTGALVMMRGGAASMLDQRKAVASLAAATPSDT